ncbi:hypothetical protein SLA2020_275280 [Shorea laevis]
MNCWDDLQSRLLSQFRNASSIIERLQVLQDSKYYSALNCVDDIIDAVLRKQMESLEIILVSMKITMEEFHGIVLSIKRFMEIVDSKLKVVLVSRVQNNCSNELA